MYTRGRRADSSADFGRGFQGQARCLQPTSGSGSLHRLRKEDQNLLYQVTGKLNEDRRVK